MKKATRFILLRHARTAWNEQKRIQGRADSPLTEESEDSALRWGDVLAGRGIDRIISSPLERASATAGLINSILRIPLTEDTRLIEQDWGEWTGLTLKEVKTNSPGAVESMEARGWSFMPPGGEDRLHVLDRSIPALKDVHERFPGRTVLVIAHSGIIKCLVYKALGRKFLPTEPKILEPDCAHVMVMEENNLKVETLNAVCCC